MKKIAIFSLIGLCLVGAGWGSHELYVALKPYNLGDYDVTSGKVRSKNVPNGANTDSLLVVNNSTREFRRIAPLSTTLAGYPTNSQLTSVLSGYVTTSSLSSQLSSYATTASVNTGLSGKANNSNTITVNGVSATLGSNPVFNVKSVATYSGTTNVSGNYTVTFPTAYAVAPNVQASIPNQSSTNQFIRVSSVTTTGFTVNVYQRSAVTLLAVEVLLAATTNVSGANVQAIVTPN